MNRLNNPSLPHILIILFFLASPACFSSAEGQAPWQGLVEIETNRLYMLPVGKDAGLQKGDRVDVLREDERVATLRLTSVLADSSMAEVVEISGSNAIQDTDSLVCPRLKAHAVQKKGNVVEPRLPPQPESSVEPEEVPEGIQSPQENGEGTAVAEKENAPTPASPAMRGEPAATVTADAGQQNVQEKWQEQIRVLGEQLEQAKAKKDKDLNALTASLREKEAIIDNLSKEKYQISFDLEQSRKEIADLKQDMTGLKKEVDSVKTFRSTSGKTGDDPFEKRVDKLNKNLADIQRQCQEEISMARDEARQELFGEYDRWQQKIYDTKEAYEGQLEKHIQALKEKEAVVKSLQSEKFGLAAELGDRDQQLGALRREVAVLQKDLESAKATPSEKLRITQGSLDEKIKELSALKSEYSERLKSIEAETEQKILAAKTGSEEKIVAVKAEYEAKISEQKSGYEKQLKNGQAQLKETVAALNLQVEQLKTDRDKGSLNLKAQLKEKETQMASLSKEKTDLLSNLKQSEKRSADQGVEITKLKEDLQSARSSESGKTANYTAEITKLQEQMKTKERELESLRASQAGQIQTVKASLEEKVGGLNKEIVSLKDTYEERLNALKTQSQQMILAERQKEQINMEEQKKVMDSLSNDKERLSVLLHDKEAQLAQWEKKAAESEEKIKTITAPLEEKIEGLNKVLFTLEQTYDQKLTAAVAEKERGYSEAEAQWKKDRQEIVDSAKQIESALNNLREEKEKERLAFEAQIKEKEQIVESLGRDKSNLSQDVQHGEQRLTRFKEQVEELTKELASLRQSQAGQIQSAKAPLEKKIEGLNDEMISLRNTYEEKINALKAESQETLLGERGKWQVQLGEIEDSAKQLEKDKDGYITTLLSELKDKQTVLNDLNTKNSDLSSRLSSSEKELADLKKEAAILRKDLEVAISAEEEKIRLAKLPLEERIVELNNEIMNLTKEYREKSVSQERELRQSLTLEQAQLKSQMEGTVKQYETQLAKQNKIWENKLNDNQAKLYEDLARLKTQYDELKSQTDRKILTLVAQLDEKQAFLGELTKEKTALTNKRDQTHNELIQANQQLGALKKELEETTARQAQKIQSVKGPLDEKIKDINNTVEMLKKEYEARMASVTKETAQAQSKLTADLSETKKQQERDMAAREGQADILRKERNDLILNLDQTRKQAENVRGEIIALKASYAADVRLAKEPLEQKIKSLSAEIGTLKRDSEYKLTQAYDTSRRELLENDRQWEARLEKIKEQYETELQVEISRLTDEFTRLQDDKDSQLFAMQVDYEDKINGLREDSQEMIERLRKQLSRTQEEIYLQETGSEPFTLTAVPRTVLTAAPPAEDNAVFKSHDYYSMIREMILNNFKKSDFLAYQNHEDYVRIEFELFSNGSLKEQPQFFGTTDERLKEILYQHFLEALPFPPFPENIKKESQRFTIIISFKNQ